MCDCYQESLLNLSNVFHLHKSGLPVHRLYTEVPRPIPFYVKVVLRLVLTRWTSSSAVETERASDHTREIYLLGACGFLFHILELYIHLLYNLCLFRNKSAHA